jgi:hypothetical protein
MAVTALFVCYAATVYGVTEEPVETPPPAAAATPKPTETPPPEPTPVLTGGPLPEIAAPPQEDLSEYGLPNDALVNPYVTYTYDQLLEDIAQLEEKYPGLISSYSIGTSVEGRDIPAFNLGRGKREVVICSTMHACEHIATNVLMRMVDEYCRGYINGDSCKGLSYREILDGVKFIIVPMLNPDGVNIAQFGPDAAMNPEAVRSIGGEEYNYAGWKANANGVDLNGNFKYKWGIRDEVTAPSSEGYAGPEMASEPETQAMMELLDSTDFYMLISLHIRGEVLYWLDTDTLDLYNKYYPLARRFSDAFGFELLSPEDVTDRGGYMVNSARIEYGKFAMTVELCPYISTDPYPLDMFDRSYKPVYPLLLLAGDEALRMDRLSVVPDVIYKGKVLAYYPVRPFMDEGCALVPAFDILSRCGAVWEWWGEPAGKLKASLDGNTVELKLGDDTMTVNGTKVKLDAPMRFRNGTLMIPACQVLRSLRLDVDWDRENLNVVIR